MVPWKRTFVMLCGRTTDRHVVVRVRELRVREAEAIASTLNATSAVSWITLMTMAVIVEPAIPRNAMQAGEDREQTTTAAISNGVASVIPNRPRM